MMLWAFDLAFISLIGCRGILFNWTYRLRRWCWPIPRWIFWSSWCSPHIHWYLRIPRRTLCLMLLLLIGNRNSWLRLTFNLYIHGHWRISLGHGCCVKVLLECRLLFSLIRVVLWLLLFRWLCKSHWVLVHRVARFFGVLYFFLEVLSASIVYETCALWIWMSSLLMLLEFSSWRKVR